MNQFSFAVLFNLNKIVLTGSYISANFRKGFYWSITFVSKKRAKWGGDAGNWRHTFSQKMAGKWYKTVWNTEAIEAIYPIIISAVCHSWSLHFQSTVLFIFLFRALKNTDWFLLFRTMHFLDFGLANFGQNLPQKKFQ